MPFPKGTAPHAHGGKLCLPELTRHIRAIVILGGGVELGRFELKLPVPHGAQVE
jgi:hypothetical protein